MTLGLAPGNKWFQQRPTGQAFETTFSEPYIFGYLRYQNRFGQFYSRYCTQISYLGKDEEGKDKLAISSVGPPAWSHFT